ncbi:MAG TPA: hypothetical protein VGP12_08225 [Nitrosospira sp.]|jgi:hypothetical protein|nr:hypothetical protein [Nitrosospira sp.]
MSVSGDFLQWINDPFETYLRPVHSAWAVYGWLVPWTRLLGAHSFGSPIGVLIWATKQVASPLGSCDTETGP